MPSPTRSAVGAVGRAAFFLFLYLEVLDASFSFDGVIGAFAITSDPIIIAIGLGIGAMFIRSLTVFLVRKGTLAEYVYLEHGALWAIGALAVVLLITIEYEVSEVVTGLIGVGFIAAALVSSIVRNRREAGEPHEVELGRGGSLMPIDYTKRPKQPRRAARRPGRWCSPRPRRRSRWPSTPAGRCGST